MLNEPQFVAPLVEMYQAGANQKEIVETLGISYCQCRYCGPKYPSIDHIIPISKGGAHTWENVQVAHFECNPNKRDYIGEEWHNGTEKTA